MQVKISGMHCPACKMLISLEAEDLGFENKLKEIQIVEGENLGIVEIEQITDEELDKFKQAVNKHPNYSVIE